VLVLSINQQLWEKKGFVNAKNTAIRGNFFDHK
jgi:hypothetical protein